METLKLLIDKHTYIWHHKEADSKQSPGIKAVSTRDHCSFHKRPQLYRSKEVDSKQSPGRRQIPSSHHRKERRSTHHSGKDQEVTQGRTKQLSLLEGTPRPCLCIYTRINIDVSQSACWQALTHFILFLLFICYCVFD